MRTIINKEIPDHLHSHILIKSSDVKRYRCMSAALERTLNHCSKIHFDFESRANEMRDNCEKEGYSTGVRLFFSQLISMLDDYEQQHNARMEAFRTLMIDAIETSFNDPEIVERIIYHIKKICCQQNINKVIIPRTVKLADEIDSADYQFTDDKHITLLSDKEAIRFQSVPQCRQWLAQAESEMTAINETIHKIIPAVFIDIGWKLISLGNNKNEAQANLLQGSIDDIT